MALNFIQHPTPIIPRGTGTFDRGDVANPRLLVDPKLTRGYKYILTYSAYGIVPGDASDKWRLCYAYSNTIDRTDTWIPEPANPILGPVTGEGYIAANGVIVLKGNTYYYFYQTGNSGDLPSTKIRLKTSTDLMNWTAQNGGNPVILPTSGSYDATSLFDPDARLLDDGITFRLSYAAVAANGHSSLATAISTNGINWTKEGQVWADAGSESNNRAEPSLLEIANKKVLSADGPYGSGRRRIVGGEIVNGVVQAGVLLSSEYSWSSASVFDSDMNYENKKIYMFFAGGTVPTPDQGLNAQIGVAVADFYPYSVFANESDMIFPLSEVTFEAAGINPANVTSILRIKDGKIRTHRPDKAINSFDSFEVNIPYIVKAKQNIDLSPYIFNKHAS